MVFSILISSPQLFFNRYLYAAAFKGAFNSFEEYYGGNLMERLRALLAPQREKAATCLSDSEFCCGPAQAYRLLALEYQLLE